jgi:hypothetical protein
LRHIFSTMQLSPRAQSTWIERESAYILTSSEFVLFVRLNLLNETSIIRLRILMGWNFLCLSQKICGIATSMRQVGIGGPNSFNNAVGLGGLIDFGALKP